MPRVPQTLSRPWFTLLWLALTASWCVGMFARDYWTPDEPREADIAWRMSWQPDKAVPLLAGEPFCEKPPLTYWVAGAVMATVGKQAWAARLPNLLYAVLTAWAVGTLGRRCGGPLVGAVAAAAMGTFLLSYQVAIWLATDAPLLAATSVALLGLHVGYCASRVGERLLGYTTLHAALAAGFLAKSAVAWMVPVLCLATLVVWDRRWRELLRWELYAGGVLQAGLILTWVGFVYAGPDGGAHLKVFFWNNLAGRFARVDAPQALQYATGHRNTPGKYLLELPVYLWPWTLLVLAAVRGAWRQRSSTDARRRLTRFAAAIFVPTLAVLSVAATARNIYLAPALPGVALLLGLWVRDLEAHQDPWDIRAVRATAWLLLAGVLVLTAVLLLIGQDAAAAGALGPTFVGVSAAGLLAAALAAGWGLRAAGRGALVPSVAALWLAYAALLIAPASQAYRRVDRWQDFAVLGAAIAHGAAGRPLILVGADETTRAFIDMDTRTSVDFIAPPLSEQSTNRLRERLAVEPHSLVLSQLPGRDWSPAVIEAARRLGLAARLDAPSATRPGVMVVAPAGESALGRAELPAWARDLDLTIAYRYGLPNGRRYALLTRAADSAER